MGTNEVHDDTRPNRPADRTRTDPLARRAHGTATDEDADRDRNRDRRASARTDAHADRAPAHPDRTPDPGPVEETERYVWLAVLPAAATLAGVAIGLVFGFGVFDTTQPGTHRVFAYLLLVPYFLLGVAGTLWLYEDAVRLAAESAEWQPNPWHYVVGGGLVLELSFLAPVLTGAGPASGVVAYLAGGLIVSLLLSSIVAGPVYALQRHRHRGTP